MTDTPPDFLEERGLSVDRKLACAREAYSDVSRRNPDDWHSEIAVRAIELWEMSDRENCPDCEEQAGVIVGLRNHLGFVLDREADTQRRHDATIEAQAAEIEKLREALKHQGGPLCMARYHPTAECTCGVSAALGETK